MNFSRPSPRVPGAAQPADVRGIRDERWKLVLTIDAAGKVAPQQLYDLGADVSEKFDRVKQHPDVVARLAAAAQQFYDEIHTHVRPAGRRGSAPGAL
ncbi:MAG: hypothetical protein Q7S40_02785 [Opitutaceae bacterium]|nr:hypothetical protein [Opitutaceae bacterium]